MLYQGTNGEFYDAYNMIPVGVWNTVLGSGSKGSMAFNGDGQVGIWRLANYDFQSSIVIRFDITVDVFNPTRTGMLAYM